MAAQQKIRWGELEEDDGGDLDFLLPPRVVVGPDENGLKKVIEYRFDDDGNKVRVTTTTRVRKLARARLSRSAIERRQWPKFGDALKEDAGSRLTMVSTEEILLERPRAPAEPVGRRAITGPQSVRTRTWHHRLKLSRTGLQRQMALLHQERREFRPCDQPLGGHPRA
uniref:Eukaryotic translation initiation factor 3 subunit G N-terminal domain-containing protein n=1 Tax=Zea mays TaxID=4577 RepID=A0A804NNE8_MAIZE